jgi:hypothetical protein
MGVPGSGGTQTTGDDAAAARVIRRAVRGANATDKGLTPDAIRQLVREELQRAGVGTPASPAANAPSGSPGPTSPLAGIRRLVRRELRRLQTGSQAGESTGPASGTGSESKTQAQAGPSPRKVRAVIRQELQSAGANAQTAGANGSAESLTAELAANLQELRRVIQQSQQLARKIEEALGQEPSRSGGSA